MQVSGATGAAVASAATGGTKPKDDPTADFMAFMNQTPAERLQTLWLAQHGISKEKFDSMSPEEKQKLVEKLQQEMKEEMRVKAAKGLPESSPLA